MNADFYIKQGDVKPPLVTTLIGDDDQPIDLTHTTVYLNVKIHGQDQPLLHVPVAIDPDQVNKKGRISYQWVQGDTDNAGICDFECEIILGGDLNLQQRVPNDGYMILLITPKVAG